MLDGVPQGFERSVVRDRLGFAKVPVALGDTTWAHVCRCLRGEGYGAVSLLPTKTKIKQKLSEHEPSQTQVPHKKHISQPAKLRN